jgi:hypothetical protein
MPEALRLLSLLCPFLFATLFSLTFSEAQMNRRSASRHLKEKWDQSYKPSTLAKLAVVGGGPEFRYIGRFPDYTEEGLDEWMESRMSRPVRSTRERRQAIGAKAPRLSVHRRKQQSGHSDHSE